MNKQKLSYIAGLFDGEGCFCVRRNKKKNGFYSYRGEISITIREKFILDDIQKMFGGSVKDHSRIERNGKNGKCWRWSLYGPKAFEFACALAPYLQVKSRQCTAMCNIGQYLYQDGSERVENRCSKYYLRLKKYNQRGPKRGTAKSTNRWLVSESK